MPYILSFCDFNLLPELKLDISFHDLTKIVLSHY